jgi:hypothetical protein
MRGLWSTFFVVVMCALVAPASAQPKKKDKQADKADKADKGEKSAPADTSAQPGAEKGDKKKGDAAKKEKNFDFNALDLNGRMRTPQLLYFLERANEELERASLEKRSFIPHMVRSVEEERL